MKAAAEIGLDEAFAERIVEAADHDLDLPLRKKLLQVLQPTENERSWQIID
jgi:hypothetical protein